MKSQKDMITERNRHKKLVTLNSRFQKLEESTQRNDSLIVEMEQLKTEHILNLREKEATLLRSQLKKRDAHIDELFKQLCDEEKGRRAAERLAEKFKAKNLLMAKKLQRKETKIKLLEKSVTSLKSKSTTAERALQPHNNKPRSPVRPPSPSCGDDYSSSSSLEL